MKTFFFKLEKEIVLGNIQILKKNKKKVVGSKLVYVSR